jgi:hypothetical protein
MNKKLLTWVLIILFFIGVGYWLFRLVTKPLPGEAAEDIGREHVTDIAGVKYSSNPPSSGPHFAVWAKPGVYDRLISDGYYIHSMEHGYIVIWYDCTKSLVQTRSLSTVFAHDEPAKESSDSGQFLMHMKVQPTGTMSWFTPDNPPEVEIELPEDFSADSCKNLIGELTKFTEIAERVILAPRVGMDSPIALTAWGRIQKLDNINDKQITEFIKSFHNKGPEVTTE